MAFGIHAVVQHSNDFHDSLPAKPKQEDMPRRYDAEFAASKSRPPTRCAGSLTTKPLDMGGKLGNRRELDTVALIELVDTHPCQPAKGCDFLGIFSLALLK
jgi:hypothetical protein